MTHKHNTSLRNLHHDVRNDPDYDIEGFALLDKHIRLRWPTAGEYKVRRLIREADHWWDTFIGNWWEGGDLQEWMDTHPNPTIPFAAAPDLDGVPLNELTLREKRQCWANREQCDDLFVFQLYLNLFVNET